nr:hypothetical protein [uncultured bacterium]AMP50762.1 hypothetical protein [uncultured bacterium]AMP50778.1 hypothetical protein [uncultured bacterium]AMP50887.1 hypothetical protein [uncultured bacterium]
MSEEWSAMETFYPILVQGYIRSVMAAKLVKIQAENKEISPVKFKLNKEYYDQLTACDVQTPLIGLKLSYDENSSLLTVEPEAYFIEEYENQIMRDVAVKQTELCQVRYSKFIEPVEA